MEDRIYAILSTIVAASNNGEATIIEKEELLEAISEYKDTTAEELEGIIRELIATEYITLKYKDNEVYCVMPTEKAIVVATSSTKSLPVFMGNQGAVDNIELGKKIKKAAFSGAITGSLVGMLIAGGIVGILIWLGVI